jgi:phosphohistidine phosphatase SixA
VVGRALLLLVALAFAAGCGGDDEPSSSSGKERPLVGQMRAGGLTLVIRHATADNEITKQEKLSSCELQRNLTEAGKAQAQAIGAGIKALKIPIAEVETSPMCRTFDTATIAFGEVSKEEDLVSPGVIGTEADDKRHAAALRARVEKAPAEGENRVLVTHTGNIGSALGEETVAEGETLVYAEGAKLVGRVKAEEWTALAEDAGKRPTPPSGGGS